VARLGLLPSATHERVRNIVASPRAGLVATPGGSPASAGTSASAGMASAETPVFGGVAVDEPGLDELVRALDRSLCADAELAGLSGRFLFGLDDGTGDIAALSPDAWAAHVGPGRWWVAPTGVEVGGAAVIEELLAAARAFLRAAGDLTSGDPSAGGRSVWRVRDLPDHGAGLAAALRYGRPAVQAPDADPNARPVGLWRRPDGGLAGAVQVPLGRLTRQAAELLASATADVGARAALAGVPAVAGGLRPNHNGDGPRRQPLRVTPWRGVVVPSLADPAEFAARAQRAGLVTDPDSLWARVTACAGRPGCANALADVRADAHRAVAAGSVIPVADVVQVGSVVPVVDVVPVIDTVPVIDATRLARAARPGVRAHWSGCGRRCGRPGGPHVEVVAGPAGYLVRDAGADPKESPGW
jgi:precorrin-3B synthase